MFWLSPGFVASANSHSGCWSFVDKLLVWVVVVGGYFFSWPHQYSLVAAFLQLPVCRVRTVAVGSWRMQPPTYCRHHHSASVPLCCLLPVSLTAVSQASAYREGNHTDPSFANSAASKKVMFTISICWSPVTVTTCRNSFTRRPQLSACTRGLVATVFIDRSGISDMQKLLQKSSCISLAVASFTQAQQCSILSHSLVC